MSATITGKSSAVGRYSDFARRRRERPAAGLDPKPIADEGQLNPDDFADASLRSKLARRWANEAVKKATRERELLRYAAASRRLSDWVSYAGLATAHKGSSVERGERRGSRDAAKGGRDDPQAGGAAQEGQRVDA